MNRFRRACSLGMVVLGLWAQLLRAADDKTRVNLLRLPSVKVEASSLPTGEWAAFHALTDGNPASVALIKAPGGTVEIVYGFSGEMVAPERLVVHLPRPMPADAQPRTCGPTTMPRQISSTTSGTRTSGIHSHSQGASAPMAKMMNRE